MQRNRIAWTFFQTGMPMLCCGQEWAADHTPSLFDADPVAREGAPAHEALLRTLIAMKKDPLFDTGVCSLEARENDTVVASRTKDGRTAVGVFSLKGRSAQTPVPLADGTYRELLSGAGITVRNGAVAAAGEPLIFLVG